MNDTVEAEIKLMNTKEFSAIVEEIVANAGCSYMDAIIDYCEKNGTEIETMAKLINVRIKGLIQVEAEDLHFLPKTRRLPI